MKVVILAGGKGTRLAEETTVRPKPMVAIGDKPIIWHIMKIYSHYGINEFVVCLGYLGYVIKEYFCNYYMHNADVKVDLANNQISVGASRAEPWMLDLIDTGLDTNTGGRILRAGRALDDDDLFCMTYGDGVGDVDIRSLIEFHRSHGRLATMTGVMPPSRFGSFMSKDGKVAAFAEKPRSEGMVNGGFFVLSPKVLDYIDGDHVAWEQEPMERLVREEQLMVYPHHGFWQPVDTLRERNELNDLWRTGSAPWKVWP